MRICLFACSKVWFLLLSLGKFIIVCGHYGCGKTNLSLNLALDRAERNEKVILVDMDIVNPYFRSSDQHEMLEGHGIRVISPSLAGSTLDAPALSAELNAIFDYDGTVIIDAGGDDAGATALGRYHSQISALNYDMLYVLNFYRPQTSSPDDAIEILREIEAASRLKATALANNSHLIGNTSKQTILDALPLALKTSDELSLPLLFTTVPKQLAGTFDIDPIYPITRYVRSPWEN